MAVTPDTEIRLIKCNLDLDDNNQINFANATEQYNYFNGLTHLTVTSASYQRKDNYIRYPAHIDSIIQYNYCMYKNTHYNATKWFYAYITRMEYENDNCTRVYIKTDVWQTWQFDLTFKKSFVEREHTNDDTVGNNTVPENLETGEYIINSVSSLMGEAQYYPVVSTAPLKHAQNITEEFNRPTSTAYNDVFGGSDFYVFDSTSDAYKFLQYVDVNGQNDAINCIFMIPKLLFNKLTKTSYTFAGHGSAGQEAYIPSFNYYVITAVTITNLVNQHSITAQQSLNGYTPRNKKLLTYPYNFLEVCNNSGGSVIYKYEQFVNNTPKFNVDGAVCPGCSIHLYPVNYNKISDTTLNQTGIKYAWQDGLNAGKYPIGSWNCDSYTNWLTQNSINNELGIRSSMLTLATGVGAIATGVGAGVGIGMVAGGIFGIANSVAEIYKHSLSPNEASGNTNVGDCTYAHRNLLFAFNKKSIKAEFARIIDDFWDMYGYKVNRLKIPNFTSRTNWNYVKLINPNIEGYIPQEDLQEIKRLFSNGITIWHKTNYFLDYSQTNNIVT